SAGFTQRLAAHDHVLAAGQYLVAIETHEPASVGSLVVVPHPQRHPTEQGKPSRGVEGQGQPPTPNSRPRLRRSHGRSVRCLTLGLSPLGRWALPMNVLSLVLTQHFDHDDMMGGSGWWWLWGTLMMIVVLAGIALVAWLIVRSVQSRGPSRSGAQSARDILNERYARGEIDTDEYEHRLSKLR